MTLMERDGPGRPKADIDWAYVDKMLVRGATSRGIAATIGIAEDTLRKRCVTDNKCEFSEYRQQKAAKGDELLRAKQFEVAMSGDKTMLIWLGKQRLDQSEKTSSDINLQGDVNVGFAEFAQAAEKMYGDNGGSETDDSDGD